MARLQVIQRQEDPGIRALREFGSSALEDVRTSQALKVKKRALDIQAQNAQSARDKLKFQQTGKALDFFVKGKELGADPTMVLREAKNVFGDDVSFEALNAMGEVISKAPGGAEDRLLEAQTRLLEQAAGTERPEASTDGASRLGALQDSPSAPGGLMVPQMTVKGVTISNPTVIAELERIKTKARKEGESEFARESLRDDLESFFAIDEAIRRSEGGFFDRMVRRGELFISGLRQDTAEGQFVAAYDGAVKRLRPKLARAAGDVGNLSVVEQVAAGAIVPGLSDAQGVAEIKRAFLREISSAIRNKDSNLVKDIVDRFRQSEAAPKDVRIEATPRTRTLERLEANTPNTANIENLSDEELDRLELELGGGQ